MVFNKKLLVIGCGRSGTMFTAHLLPHLGLAVGHEQIDRDGMVSWKEVVQPYWKLRLQYRYIFHQVREPISCINSIKTISETSWNYIASYIPVKEDDSLDIKAAKYWYYWNKMAEKKASLTIKMEELESWVPFFVEKFHLQYNYPEDFFTKPINSRKQNLQKLDWDTLNKASPEIHDKVAGLAYSYGYI